MQFISPEEWKWLRGVDGTRKCLQLIIMVILQACASKSIW